MDNIYIPDYLTKNELKKKRKRVYPVFIDFISRFDKVNKKKMFETMRKLKVSGWLMQKLKEIYEMTKIEERIREKRRNGLKQQKSQTGVPNQSPVIYNVCDRDEGIVQKGASGRMCDRQCKSIEVGVCEWSDNSGKE